MRASLGEHPFEPLIDENLFERILRLTPDVVYVYDLVTGRNVFANRQITDMLGYHLGTIRQFGDNVLQALVHPEDWPGVQAHVGRMRLARDNEVVACEYRMRHADGSWRVLLSRDQALRRDQNSRVRQILGFATDLTALKQKDRLLRKSAEQLSILFQAIAECYIALDRDGRVIELNAHAAEWVGAAVKAVIGKRLSDVLASDPAVLDTVAEAYASRKPHHTKMFSPRHHGRCFELSAYPGEDGAGLVIRDVTDREHRDRERREIATRLLEVQDKERRRIGRELHDSTGQTLVGIQLGLARLGAKLAQDHEAQDILGDLKDALKLAQSDLRVFSLLLHPPLLEGSNVSSVLQQFARSFAERTGLTIDFHCKASLRGVRPDLGLTLLRITQEALANVHSHARATNVRIRLAKKDGQLTLEIADDGIGLPRNNKPATKARIGVGLAGMRARARELHGDLTIERGKAGGTLVRATLPVEQLLMNAE